MSQDVRSELKALIAGAEAGAATKEKLTGWVNAGGSLWSAANLAGNYYNDNSLPEGDTALCKKLITAIREYQGKRAGESTEPTTVVFGTSGWRGIIGEDFTLLNVHKVTASIIDMMKSEEFMKTNGYTTFKEVQEKGILVFRDNRYMGDDFMDGAMKELAATGIKIYFAGECPTGVGSALVTELGAAGSINFTPSHNPMNYAGLKFNPADGGPADKNLTDLIMKESEKYMKGDFSPSGEKYTCEKVDKIGIFKAYLGKSEIFNLEETRAWLKSVKNDLFLAIDNMHGASRGFVEGILGEDLIAELKEAGAVVFLNTEEDFSFHGVKPEPSARNMQPLIRLAGESGRKLTFTGALDPDADRIRFGSADMDIDMNKFGAIAYGCLLDKGLKGPVASTAPTSDFALKIARDNNQEIYETAVGFKWFRPYRDALVAFEESDGISFKGHTLEKDAIAGFLMAIDVMRYSGENIDKVYTSLQERYGYYICDKIGVDVEGVSVEQWQAYKARVVHVLQHELYKPGDTITVGKGEKKIARINIIDGLKVIFEDGSWILARPSGTEPKFRIYGEVTSKTKPSASEEKDMLDNIFATGKGILNKARSIVEGR